MWCIWPIWGDFSRGRGSLSTIREGAFTVDGQRESSMSAGWAGPGPGQPGRSRSGSTHGSPRERRTTRPRTWLRWLARLGLATACAILAAEGLLRWGGREPAEKTRPDFPLTIVPGGLLYQADPELGFTHRPGRFELEFPGIPRWTMSHDERGFRRTRRAQAPLPTGPRLVLCGDSWTHGFGVEDEATFAWQLQARFPLVEVRNCGVDGYNTAQAVLTLESELARSDSPSVAVLGFVGCNADWNVLPRGRRKSLMRLRALGVEAQPYAEPTGDGRWRIAQRAIRYRGLWGMRRSALVNLVDELWNVAEHNWADREGATAAMLRRWQQTCAAAGTRGFVVGLDRDPRTRRALEIARAAGAQTADVSFDPGDARLWLAADQAHPSPLGQAQLAESLAAVLAPFLELDRLAQVEASR